MPKATTQVSVPPMNVIWSHWAGHHLTALAQAYADQGEAVYKEKLDWMVAELAACQAAITARMGAGGPGGEEPPEPTIDRVPGRYGKGLRLNGPSKAQYVTLPQEAINQLTDFTIAAWVNLASDQSWSRLFDFGQSTTVNMFLTPRAGVTGDVPRFAITVGGSGQEQRITGSTALPLNQWVHLAVTLSQNTGNLAQQKTYTTFAHQMGWEYNLIDDGFDKTQMPALQQFSADSGVMQLQVAAS